jgi:hypothetical protein
VSVYILRDLACLRYISLAAYPVLQYYKIKHLLILLNSELSK